MAKKSKGSGKNKKKKWSKAKSKEKLNNSVFWTLQLFNKLSKEIISKEQYITPSVISEKLKVNVSLARAAIQQLITEEKLMPYNFEPHSRWGLYVKTDKFQKELDSKPIEISKDKSMKVGEKKQDKQEKKEQLKKEKKE